MLHIMVSTSRTACVLLAAAAVLMASCTRIVDDARPVAGPDRSPIAAASDGSQCESVDAKLTTIPAQGDDEPVMKIPQPPGWDRMTMMDSELIRFAMANRSLTSGGFASNVVVTLENAPGIEDPDVVFDTMRDALESDLGVTDLRVSEHTLCGLPAETMNYQTPIMGNIDPHPGVAVVAVLHADDTTYAVSVTVQTKDPDNPDFKRDSEEILKGFQLLPPSET
jgi:hypothetical protein